MDSNHVLGYRKLAAGTESCGQLLQLVEPGVVVGAVETSSVVDQNHMLPAALREPGCRYAGGGGNGAAPERIDADSAR
jgi:hypothetical protein